MNVQQRTILYVEDDADDREFLTEAISEASPDVRVICAENGLVALKYLDELKNHSTALPCLIVLDINMPFMDGKAVYQAIKKDPVLDQVPVMILSSSERPDDKKMFSNLGVEFITKPSDLLYMNAIANKMVSSCC